jgi:hypothetical protein
VRVRAKGSYDPGDMEALVLRAGEYVEYTRKATEWTGWIWCTAANGKSAWVPESWVELSGRYCLVLREYNSRELAVTEGQALELELIESGWAWVRDSEGEHGWIPANQIEPREPDTI